MVCKRHEAHAEHAVVAEGHHAEDIGAILAEPSWLRVVISTTGGAETRES